MKNKAPMLYMRFVYFVRFFSDTLFGTYTVLYLTEVGFKEGIIGTISSITTLTMLIMNPIWTLIIKNNKIKHVIIVLLSILEGICILIYRETNIATGIMALTALMAICRGPYFPVLDSYASGYANEFKKPYSSVRIMGSLAALIGSFTGGMLVKILGYNGVFLISGILMIASGASSIFLKSYGYEKSKTTASEGVGAIVKNKGFWLFTISSIIILSAYSIGDVYLPLLLTKVNGLTPQQYSYVNTGTIVVEITVLFLADKLFSKFKRRNLLTLTGIIILIRVLLLAFEFMPTGIIVSAVMLKGVTTAITCYYEVNYLIDLVGASNLSQAIMIKGIISSIINIFFIGTFGYLIEGLGYHTVYLILAVMTGIGVLGYALISKALIKRRII